jgi:hypothetical protein
MVWVVLSRLWCDWRSARTIGNRQGEIGVATEELKRIADDLKKAMVKASLLDKITLPPSSSRLQVSASWSRRRRRQLLYVVFGDLDRRKVYGTLSWRGLFPFLAVVTDPWPSCEGLHLRVKAFS